MKRIALVASVFVFAACAPKAEEAAPATEAAATTAAPAMDTAAMTDTTMKDSTAAAPADTTKH